MLTTTEIAVTVTIWVLTTAGAFFSIRAALRRRKAATNSDKVQDPAS